jgi:hypothetical protein
MRDYPFAQRGEGARGKRPIRSRRGAPSVRSHGPAGGTNRSLSARSQPPGPTPRDLRSWSHQPSPALHDLRSWSRPPTAARHDLRSRSQPPGPTPRDLRSRSQPPGPIPRDLRSRSHQPSPALHDLRSWSRPPTAARHDLRLRGKGTRRGEKMRRGMGDGMNPKRSGMVMRLKRSLSPDRHGSGGGLAQSGRSRSQGRMVQGGYSGLLCFHFDRGRG